MCNKRWYYIIVDKNQVDACTSTDDIIVKNQVDACTSTDDIIVKNQVDACTSTDDLIVKNQVDACTSNDDIVVKNQVNTCTSTDDIIVKNQVNACTSTDDVCTNENEPCANENENKNEPCTNENENESDDDDSDDDDDDDSDDKPCNNDNNGNNDNKPDNKDNNDNNGSNDNKPGNNDNNDNKDNNHNESSQLKCFLNNLTNIIELVNELNDQICDGDQWLVYAQLNKINPLLDDLIDRVWLIIYNKAREKNEIINIYVDKDKDIEGYVGIYNKIVNDKLEFVNKINELLNNANEKKEFENLKDDVLKLIDNSCVCDVKRKGCKKDNKEKDSGDSKNNDNNNNNNGNDNLIDKLLDNDKLPNFIDNILNNLIGIAKLKEKLLNNIEKIRATFNKIENVPKNDIRSILDKYKNLNILLDDPVNPIWRILYSKNRANNEMDNIDCDKVVDAKIYASKYINIVNDKLFLINAVSDSIDKLMEGLDGDTSNDIAKEKLKDFKSIMLKSVNKFNSYVKQDTKTKVIEEKDNNNDDDNDNDTKPDIKQATIDDIKAYIIDNKN